MRSCIFVQRAVETTVGLVDAQHLALDVGGGKPFLERGLRLSAEEFLDMLSGPEDEHDIVPVEIIYSGAIIG